MRWCILGSMAIFAGHSLSRADAAWLHAESPTNHFVVTSLALLDSPPRVERVAAMLKRRISIHPHLTDVVAEPMAPMTTPRWVVAPGFDLDAHIHRAALPRPAGIAELATFIGDLAGRPLDFGRPLWEIHVVEGPGDLGAVVGRFHHSLGDGQAMVRLLLALTDETADGWRRPLHRHRPRPGRTAARDGRSAVARMLDMLPSTPEVARTALRGAGTLARLTMLDADRPTLLRGRLSFLKSISWTKPIALGQVEAIAKASGTTVNDVVVSAIAGALGAYLRRHGNDSTGLRIRAMVPVNLRAQVDTSMEGNRFSLVYLELPVGVQDGVERLQRVKREMDRIKDSLEPATGWLLVQGLGFLPPPIERLASGFYATKASLVLTNVIGPRQRRYFAGSRIRQMTFWEPESGGLGVGISIYSYAGSVTIGVVSDRNLIAKPQELTDEVLVALRQLAAEFQTGRTR